jgi:hypothetical protein
LTRPSLPPLDRSAAVTGLLTVVAANFLYLSGLQRILDPMMSMDPLYIRLAQGSVADILSQDPAWGPLYSLWLKPLTVFLDDPVHVYTANIYALSLGLSIVIYLQVLLLTRRVTPAVGAALFFVVCDFNVPLSSKVSGFALLVLLAGLTVAQLAASRSRRASIAAIGMLLASYARPELYLAALCSGAVAAWLAYSEAGELGARAFGLPLLVLLCISIPAVALGTPIFGGDRFFIAFREHFAWNWTQWHAVGETFQAIWSREFGSADSILQAVLTNPSAVARHLIDNLFGTARFMATSAFAHYPFLVPANQPVLVQVEVWLASACAFAALIYVMAMSNLRRQMRDNYGHVLFSYAIVALCSLLSAAMIFPAAHYLVIPSVLLLIASALALATIIPPRFEWPWPWPIGAALLCLIAMPKPFVLPSAYQVPGSRFVGRITVKRKVVGTIELVRSLGLAPPVHVLTTTDGIGEMLGTGFREIKVWQKGSEPLQAFMHDNDVGVIINLEGGRESFMIDDPFWRTIHDNPSEAGFLRVPVPNHEAVRVYVRADLMAR